MTNHTKEEAGNGQEPLNADQAVVLLRKAIHKQLDPNWRCNSDHPALRAALDATAALASQQPAGAVGATSAIRNPNVPEPYRSAIIATPAHADTANVERKALQAIFDKLDPHRDAVLWGIASEALGLGKLSELADTENLITRFFAHIHTWRDAQLARQAQAAPVAWCAADKNGKPLFGKGWMFAPVQQMQATMPLYTHAAAQAAPAVASAEQVRDAEQYKVQRDRLLDFIKNAQVSSGVCMCGSAVDGHGFGDGHSPVDVWDHSVMSIVAEIEAADALRTPASTCGTSEQGGAA